MTKTYRKVDAELLTAACRGARQLLDHAEGLLDVALENRIDIPSDEDRQEAHAMHMFTNLRALLNDLELENP